MAIIKKYLIIKIRKNLKKLTNKGSVILCQMDRGIANDQISKTLGISESFIGYYRERINNLISKRPSKLPKNI